MNPDSSVCLSCYIYFTICIYFSCLLIELCFVVFETMTLKSYSILFVLKVQYVGINHLLPTVDAVSWFAKLAVQFVVQTGSLERLMSEDRLGLAG